MVISHVLDFLYTWDTSMRAMNSQRTTGQAPAISLSVRPMTVAHLCVVPDLDNPLLMVLQDLAVSGVCYGVRVIIPLMRAETTEKGYHHRKRYPCPVNLFSLE